MPAGDRGSIFNQIAAAFCWGGGATMSLGFSPLMLLVVRSERDLGICCMISQFTDTNASLKSTLLRVWVIGSML